MKYILWAKSKIGQTSEMPGQIVKCPWYLGKTSYFDFFPGKPICDQSHFSQTVQRLYV